MKNEKNELLNLFTNIESTIKCQEFPLRKLMPRVEQKAYRVERYITDRDYMVFPEIRESVIVKLDKYGPKL